MPTNSNAYNSRVTDEALEKRFRDTFRSQGGAELVDDLYAQGVIVPVVDFTQAATGQVLAENLQTAWDTATDSTTWNQSTSGTLISNAGFWQIDVISAFEASVNLDQTVASINISDGFTTTPVWVVPVRTGGSLSDIGVVVVEQKFVVFVDSGNTVTYASGSASSRTTAWYRQIATVTGDLVNPAGFTSS